MQREGLRPPVRIAGTSTSRVTPHRGNFPVTPGAYDTTQGAVWEPFVAKLNPSTSASGLIYSTFLGGGLNDSAGRDGSRRRRVRLRHWVYKLVRLPGDSRCLDTTYNGNDWFVAKVNPSGSDLVYSTFLGGSYGEGGRGIAVDNEGNAYVTGKYATSSNFPENTGSIDTRTTA